MTSSPAVRIGDGSWEQDPANKNVALSLDRASRGLVVLEDAEAVKKISIDAVFPVLHGRNGEDGRMQGLLQIAGLPFVGSDTISSAASMDKAITKVMVEDAWRHQSGGRCSDLSSALCKGSIRRTFGASHRTSTIRIRFSQNRLTPVPP